MSKIKICGLMSQADIEAVNRYKADYAGFVFAKSRRQITTEQAEQFRHLLSKDIKAVGVFVDEEPELIAEMLEKNIIDIAQLHGNESEKMILWLQKRTGKPVWKAFLVKTENDIKRAEQSMADMLLFDQGKGSGESFDWRFLKGCARPYFLAGGIGLSNIEDAILCKPFGIDVSSGVETEGKKDSEKIHKIIDRVRAKM